MSEKRVLKSIGVAAVILGILQLSALNAEAQTTIRVPFDFPTIQEAINAALDGDTVLVASGTYVENINFLGKAITVTSEGGPEVTIIDGNQAGSVVTFSSGEGQASVLRGFTVQNGFASFSDPSFGDGGGIRIQNSSPTIEKNIITNNQACVGAGIAISFGSPIVQGNTITKNVQSGCSGGIGGGGISIGGDSSAQILDNVISENFMGSANGGGISLFAAGTPTIKGNIIRGNTATGLSPCAEGGGISLVNFSDAVIVQNLITGNSAGCGGGIFWLVPSDARGPLLVNNTIADNDSPQGSGIFADGFDAQTELINNIVVAKADQAAVFCGDFNDLNPPIFKFNNIFSPSGIPYGGICTDQTGINGNISVDPLFVDPANGNYHLQSGSPAIDAGDNTATKLPDKDIDGDPRILDGDGDDVAVVDMGVDEFTPSISAIPFAAFDTRVFLFTGNPGKDHFFARGSFTLGDESDGIDPEAEAVVFSLADMDGTFFNQTLPPGSFRRIGQHGFLFRASQGSIGVHLMIIRPTNSAGQFTFEALGKRLDLSGADNPPVTASFQIGDDAGSETIPCRNLSNVLICL